MEPTLAGFMAWVYDPAGMGVPTAALPSNSMSLVYAYNVSVELVNLQLACVSSTIYTLAVYNLAGDNLINFAPDQSGQTFFKDARQSYGCNTFTPGVVASSGDSGTSASLANPEFMKNLTMANLQNLKTPYGRQYLAFAQAAGTGWGLT